MEQVALKSLRAFFDEASSSKAVLRSVRRLTRPGAEVIGDLEAAIVAARLPVRDQGAFDGRPIKWRAGRRSWTEPIGWRHARSFEAK